MIRVDSRAVGAGGVAYGRRREVSGAYWFSYNEDDGIENHKTRKDAEESAQKSIEIYRDLCDPEWPEEVESVCFGVILGTITKDIIASGPDPEAPQYWDFSLTGTPIEAELAALREVMEAADECVSGDPDKLDMGESWMLLQAAIARARAIQGGAQ